MGWFRRSSALGLRLHRRTPLRATRHRLILPVQYRLTSGEARSSTVTAKEREWRKGHTHDISATGALLEITSQILKPGDYLELQLALPEQWVGPAHVPIMCAARVVRVMPEGQTIRVGVALERGAILTEPVARATAALEPGPEIRHNVNNLLTGIVGTAELLLLNNAIDDGERRQLTHIRDFALRAASELQRLNDSAA